MKKRSHNVNSVSFPDQMIKYNKASHFPKEIHKRKPSEDFFPFYK